MTPTYFEVCITDDIHLEVIPCDANMFVFESSILIRIVRRLKELAQVETTFAFFIQFLHVVIRRTPSPRTEPMFLVTRKLSIKLAKYFFSMADINVPVFVLQNDCSARLSHKEMGVRLGEKGEQILVDIVWQLYSLVPPAGKSDRGNENPMPARYMNRIIALTRRHPGYVVELQMCRQICFPSCLQA